MNRPENKDSPINGKRYRKWINRFGTYRTQATQPLIDAWLDQFKPRHRDAAARILDATVFLTNDQIHQAFKSLLAGQDGWHRFEAQRTGRWYFVPFAKATGESGDAMTHHFRSANGMGHGSFDQWFVHKSELPGLKLTSQDTVVLIDDFSGSGNQACKYWMIFQELLFGKPRTLLMLAAATQSAVAKISSETAMEPLFSRLLTPKENLFSDLCTWFDDKEKRALLRYCETADEENPRGYRDCGLLVVMAHQCPNNSIPILHANNDRWMGLFPRNG